MRTQVEQFATLMEAKLAKHDGERGPRGWSGDGAMRLMARLRQEVEELERALTCGECGTKLQKPNPTKVASEAADVANFAMMVADVCGALTTPLPDVA